MKKILICFVLCFVLLVVSVNAQQVSYWSFDDSNNPGKDDIGSNDGILLNGASWTPNGYNNGAIYFNGGDYIDCGNDNSLNMGTNDFSISFWYKKQAAGDTFESILYKSANKQTNVPGYGFLLRETTGHLKFTIGDGVTNIQAVPAHEVRYLDTYWHHAVGVRGGGQIKLYVDGILNGQTSDTVGSVDNNENFVIGRAGYGNNPGGTYMISPFHGKVDEVTIYNRSLSDVEINQLYQNDLANHREPPTVNLNFPSNDAVNVSTSPVLDAGVTDLDGDVMNVTFYGTNTPAQDDFTIIVLPDTQYYSQSYPSIFTNQTQWIVDNKDNLNIMFVTHEGDLVNNWDNILEWERASQSMSILDGVVPYSVLPGNHDGEYWYNIYPHNTPYYNQYFNYTRFENYSWYGGHFGNDNDNNYQLFSAGGTDFIIIHLGFDPDPSSGVLTWANDLLANHSDRKGIIVSHFIINTDGSRETAGDNIFNAVKNNSNLFLMLCGHRHDEGIGADVVNGNIIYTLLSDYQHFPLGGNGYLRMMTFSPKNNKIYVKTYSPYLNAYLTDSNSQFTLDFPMINYNEIGTNVGVASGSSTSITWSNLTEGSNHYWYAKAVDANSMTNISDVREFVTSGVPPSCGDGVCDNIETCSSCPGDCGICPDVTPPVRSNGLPSGQLPFGTIQATLSLDTDEDATCRYSTIPGTSYSSMTNTFNITGGTSHSITITGLSDGNSYAYYIRCEDTAGNPNINDYIISFSVALQNPPVTVTYYPTAGDGDVINLGQSTWQAAHDAASGIMARPTAGHIYAGRTEGGSSFTIIRGFWPFDTSGIPDNATITSATLYLYLTSVLNNDNDGDDYLAVVQTSQASTSTLTVSDFDQVGDVDGGHIDLIGLQAGQYYAIPLNSVGITWISKTGMTKIGTREGHDLIDNPVSGNNWYKTYTSEQPGTFQDPYLEIVYSMNTSVPPYCGDGVCNGVENCSSCSGDCGICPDITPPVRSNGLPTGELPSGTIQATLSLDTDEDATCRYSTLPGTSYSSMTDTFNITGGISHSTTITGLSDGNSYAYYIRCEDTAGNSNTNDYIISFSVALPTLYCGDSVCNGAENCTTCSGDCGICLDVTPPTIPTNLAATAVSSSQIDLSWSASTDNIGVAGYRVYRDGSQVADIANTYYSDTGLSPSTTYTYQVSAYDAAGLESNQSLPDSATTPAPSPVTVRFYSTLGDGDVINFAQSTWQATHDATSGILARPDAKHIYAGRVEGGKSISIIRGFWPFDTSGLPDNASIVSATLYLYLTSVIDDDNDGDDYLAVVQTSQASTSTLTVSDFDQVGDVDGGHLDLTGLQKKQYHAISLNAVGITWISKTGITKIGTREGHDLIDDPVVSGNNWYKTYTSEQPGTSQDPYLEIVYTT